METKRTPAARNQGRKKSEGTRRMYTVSDDAHEWIIAHGGGQYLTDTIRIIKAVSTLQNEKKQ